MAADQRERLSSASRTKPVAKVLTTFAIANRVRSEHSKSDGLPGHRFFRVSTPSKSKAPETEILDEFRHHAGLIIEPSTRPLDRLSNAVAARSPFYYGYVMVPVAMVLQIMSSPGQTFAFSAFTPSFRDQLGIPDVPLTAAYALGTLLASIPLTLVGPASDRFGLRRCLLVVVIALSLSCLAASFATGWWTLLLVFTSLRFLGQGSMNLLAGNSISMWFRGRIGRVGAVISVAMAAAFAVVPGMLQQSIDAIGWRMTYRWIAVIIAAAGLPTLVLLFRNRPEDVGQTLDGAKSSNPPADRSSPDESLLQTSPLQTPPLDDWTLAAAIRTPAYTILGLSAALWAMVGTGVLFYLFPIAEDLGITRDQTSTLFTVLGGAMLLTQLIGGIAVDTMRLERLLAAGLASLTIGLLSIATAATSDNPLRSLQIFAALFGGGQGLLIAVTSAAWVKYYGRANLGKIRGWVWCGTVAGSGGGPLLLGLSLRQYESFGPALYAFTAALAILTPIALGAKKPSHKLSANSSASPPLRV